MEPVTRVKNVQPEVAQMEEPVLLDLAFAAPVSN